MIPQFVSATFAVTYLVSARGWTPVAAGQLVAVVQVVGAAGRIAGGRVVGPGRKPHAPDAADRGRSPCPPWCCGPSATLLDSWLAVAALVAALIVTVTDNGLGFTATAELAGPFWAGQSAGRAEHGQNVAAMAAPRRCSVR